MDSMDQNNEIMHAFLQEPDEIVISAQVTSMYLFHTTTMQRSIADSLKRN